MADIVIIRPDPRGFFLLERYAGASKWTKADWSGAPDMASFVMTQMHVTEAEARARAAELWPEAKIRVEKALP